MSYTSAGYQRPSNQCQKLSCMWKRGQKGGKKVKTKVKGVTHDFASRTSTGCQRPTNRCRKISLHAAAGRPNSSPTIFQMRFLRINESCHRCGWGICMSCHTYVMSHIRMSHVARMNNTCCAYGWVMSHMNLWGICMSCHIWISHVTHMNEWSRVMSHMWMRYVTHISESCHAYEWVMSHIWISHVTHVNKTCHTYEWAMSHVWTSHIAHMNESCHTYEWVTSY